MIDNTVLSGIGSLQYTGTSILMSQPETGALIASTRWRAARAGRRRRCARPGTRTIRDVHLALNSGIPLVDPAGGVLLRVPDRRAGVPEVRRGRPARCSSGSIQGREIDELVADAADDVAAARRSDGELPLVRADDPHRRGRRRRAVCGSSSSCRFTYVFDRDGDKVRVVQFRGAGAVSPGTMFFGPSGRLR